MASSLDHIQPARQVSLKSVASVLSRRQTNAASWLDDLQRDLAAPGQTHLHTKQR